MMGPDWSRFCILGEEFKFNSFNSNREPMKRT